MDIAQHVSPHLVREDFDHVGGAEFLTDPFAAFDRYRGDRTFYSPHHGGYWVLTQMEDIREALGRAEEFSSWPTGIPAHPGRQERMIPLELDPPEHRSIRKLIAPLFGPRAVSTRTASIGDTVDAMIEPLVERKRIDLVADFAQPFPTTVFVNMFGLPVSEVQTFVEWNNILLHSHGDPEARRRAGDEINSYLAALIEQRRSEPREDLISALIAGDVDGRPTTSEEVRDICFLLFVAGLDTVTAALSFIFRFLAQNPGHRQQLLDDPDLIPSAVEEMLRVHAFINPGRRVTRDLEFGGVQMKEGDRVLISTALASNDPAEFADPLEVRFEREANRHIAFGAGPHRCAGSHLAREELVAAVRRWHELIPHYRIDETKPIVGHGGGAMGLDNLLLRWDSEEQA